MVGAGFQMMSSPNGEWMYYHGRDGEGRNGFYRVPTAGGAAERIGDFPSRITAGTLTVSHDGRKFVAVAFDTMGEWWLLENYEAAVASH